MTDDEFPHEHEGTAHAYLYRMPREQLYAMFVTAVSLLKVDERGVWCIRAEAESLLRLARTVQARVYEGIPDAEIEGAELSPREAALDRVAGTLRFLIPDYVVGMGNQVPPPQGARAPAGYGFDGTINHPRAGIVDEFYQQRAALPDVLPPGLVAHVSVSENVELPLDHPQVQAMIEADPDLLGFVEQARRDADDSED